MAHYSRLIPLLAALLSFAQPSLACSSTAAYRSVVVNVAPERVPENAVVLQVKINEALYSEAMQEIQGLRGSTVTEVAGYPAGTNVAVISRLASMCDTWVEVWSADHNSKGGVLTGFITGYPKEVHESYVLIEPILFQREADRNWSAGSTLSDGKVLSRSSQRRIDSNASWKKFKIDAEALAGNLDATNRAIRQNLEAEPKRTK